MGEQFVGSNCFLTEKLILIYVGSSLDGKKVKYLFCRPRTLRELSESDSSK